MDVGVGRVVGSASTGCSLAMSLELSVRDVGEAAVGVILSPGFVVKGVENCTRRDKAPSTRLPSPLSGGAADDVAT